MKKPPAAATTEGKSRLGTNQSCIRFYTKGVVLLIDIDKVIVGDRIRKDFGNLQELAENIRENTLLQPPVVTPNNDGTYTLIAGERRLRAMRDILGYKQVEVNAIPIKDAEAALRMEISENECRQNFSRTETLDWMRQLERIESAKAAERKRANGGDKKSAEYQKSDVQNFAHPIQDTGRTRDKVADTIGINHETLRQMQVIAENRDMVSEEEFAAWDEGKLSTNRVFQQIKAAKEKAEREAAQLKEEVAALEKQNDKLYEQVENAKEPRIVEREVVPADYDKLKRDNERLHNEYLDMWHEKMELDKKLDQANELLGEKERDRSANRDIEQLTIATNNYLRNYGGKVWAFDQFDRVEKTTQDEFKKAITSLAAFAQNLAQLIEDQKQTGAN